MFRIALCDDEPVIKRQLEELLRRYAVQHDREYELDFEFRYFATANELMTTDYPYDILFLDVRLDGGNNGIELGIKLRERGISAVFILLTSVDSYRDGYRANVLRYLKKPINQVELFEAVRVATQEYRQPKRRFSIRTKSGSAYVIPGDIIMLESYYRKRLVHTVQEVFVATESWTELCSRLNPHQFYNPQKSYYINFDHVVFASSSHIVMSNGRKINFSRGKKNGYAEFNEMFQKYLGG